MNIFFLDEDIEKSVTYYVDKHVVKMRVELAQLICSVHWMSGSSAPYKLTHKNHPCAIWARESLSNYKYIVNLGLSLCDELEYRYGTKEQKTKTTLLWLKDNLPNIKDVGLTLPKLAMDVSFRTFHNTDDVVKYAVENYRNYYNKDKRHLFKWTKRSIPDWIIL